MLSIILKGPRLQGLWVCLGISATMWGDCTAGLAALSKQDNPGALKAFTAAAGQGDACSQFQLGVMYHEGQGVPRDYKEALRWLHLAASQGNARAQANLGVMYVGAEGVPQDYQEALKWFRLAADQGDAQAQFGIGDMYDEGQGLP